MIINCGLANEGMSSDFHSPLMWYRPTLRGSPRFQTPTTSGVWCNRLEERIHNSIAGDPSLFARGIYHLLSNHSEVAGRERMPVHKLFPYAECVNRSCVDAALMLRTTPSTESSDVWVEALDSDH